jgi:hypothetical protein
MATNGIPTGDKPFLQASQEANLLRDPSPSESKISKVAGMLQRGFQLFLSPFEKQKEKEEEEDFEVLSSAQCFPREAEKKEEYEELLEMFLSQKIVKEVDRESFFHRSIGTKTFEECLGQIYKDLNRSMPLKLNGKLLQIVPAEEESVAKAKIREEIMRALPPSAQDRQLALASVLHQGSFASGFFSLVEACYNTRFCVVDSSPQECKLLGEQPKIDVDVNENGEITLHTRQLCIIVDTQSDIENLYGKRLPLYPIQVDAQYKNGQETITFTLLSFPFDLAPILKVIEAFLSQSLHLKALLPEKQDAFKCDIREKPDVVKFIETYPALKDLAQEIQRDMQEQLSPYQFIMLLFAYNRKIVRILENLEAPGEEIIAAKEALMFLQTDTRFQSAVEEFYEFLNELTARGFIPGIGELVITVCQYCGFFSKRENHQ